MTEWYEGKKFEPEQIEFIVESILVGALDMLESGLPPETKWEDRVSQARPTCPPHELNAYEKGVLDQAGMSISIIGAQIIRDGIGAYDALSMADDFTTKVEDLFGVAWNDMGKAVERKVKRLKGCYSPKQIYVNWPDCAKCAKAFVESLLTETCPNCGTALKSKMVAIPKGGKSLEEIQVCPNCDELGD